MEERADFLGGKNIKLNVEAVTWVDVTHSQGAPLGTRVELLKYVSIGIVIYEDERVVEIQDSFALEDKLDYKDRFINSVTAIPKGLILERIKFHREDSCKKRKSLKKLTKEE